MTAAPAQLRNKERTESTFVGKRHAFSQPVSYLFPSCLLFVTNQIRNRSSIEKCPNGQTKLGQARTFSPAVSYPK
jgi:hypothetical protein